MSRPELTAFLDQAGAASAQSEGLLHALAVAGDGQLLHQPPPKPLRDLLAGMRQRMLARALAGQPTLCPHLSYTAPSIALWLAWAPELLRCRTCAHAAGRQIRGTQEDLRCDRCRRSCRRIHNDLIALPPVVVDLPSLELVGIPAILVVAGLCPTCHRRAYGKAAP